MEKLLRKLDWIWDYYFVYFLYNSNRTQDYIDYMEKKWGKNE